MISLGSVLALASTQLKWQDLSLSTKRSREQNHVSLRRLLTELRAAFACWGMPERATLSPVFKASPLSTLDCCGTLDSRHTKAGVQKWLLRTGNLAPHHT